MNLLVFIHSRVRADEFHPYEAAASTLIGSHSFLIPETRDPTEIVLIPRPDWVDFVEMIEVGDERVGRPVAWDDGLDWFAGGPPTSEAFNAALTNDSPTRPPFAKRLIHVVFVPPFDVPENAPYYSKAELPKSEEHRYWSRAIEQVRKDLLQACGSTARRVWHTAGTLTVAFLDGRHPEVILDSLAHILRRECVMDFVSLTLVRVVSPDATRLSALDDWIKRSGNA